MNLVQQSVKQIHKESLKNYYDVTRAEDELFDMLQSNRLYSEAQLVLDFIKDITGNNNDSFKVRKMGKLLSHLFNKIKVKYDIKE
ncbi:hypothetical protein [Candidatus Pelagibacter sp. HIMB1623]|jgi:hypothetical protein|uniref:hypothetical protein n=1 Tax=Candidatus Pelagibacter sp. HIMB1623 TaxID=3413358 RepID=UPI003F84D1C7